jgi:SnoaL-like polyketide cyclase
MWWSGFGATLDGGTLHWISDDLVVGDASFTGRHVGQFAGMPATGRSIRLPFVVFVDFRDGLLAGERFVYDLNGNSASSASRPSPHRADCCDAAALAAATARAGRSAESDGRAAALVPPWCRPGAALVPPWLFRPAGVSS